MPEQENHNEMRKLPITPQKDFQVLKFSLDMDYLQNKFEEAFYHRVISNSTEPHHIMYPIYVSCQKNFYLQSQAIKKAKDLLIPNTI